METDRKWIVVRIDGRVAAVSTDYRMLARISGHLAGTEGSPAGKRHGKEAFYGEITATSTCFEEVWKLRQTLAWDDLLLFGTDFQKRVWRKLWELTHEVKPQGGIPDLVGNDGSNGNVRNDGQDGNVRNDGSNGNVRNDGSNGNVGNDGQDGNVGNDGQENTGGNQRNGHLICYSDFAELCQNRAGVRAVAHAIGLNPVSVIIPCHLVIPKEGIDKIREIHDRAQSTIFKGDDLCIGSILADTSIDFGEYALGKALKRELIIRELTEKGV